MTAEGQRLRGTASPGAKPAITPLPAGIKRWKNIEGGREAAVEVQRI